MTVNILKFISDLLHSQNINILFFKPPYKNIEEIDYGFHLKLYKDFDYGIIISYMEKNCKENIIYMAEDQFFANYVFFRLPHQIQEETDYIFASIGPVLYHEVNASQFYTLMEKLQIPLTLHKDLAEYLNAIPVLYNTHNWDSYIITIASYLFGNTQDLKLDYLNILKNQISNDYREFNNQDSQISMELIEKRYAIEEELLYAVSHGNVTKATQAHNEFIQHRIQPRVADPLRNKKNLMFVLNTLFRKAVQNGYVHPLHIDAISSRFAKQIESCVNLQQLDNLAKDMIHKYCNLVKNYSLRGYPPIIQKIINYIDFNYTEPLSLKTLSDTFSINSNYLSTLFKKEIGITLTEYINQKRIQQSLILLNTSTLTIQDIAFSVGFHDVNYFSRIFKKLQGMSPKTYRDSIQLPDIVFSKN